MIPNDFLLYSHQSYPVIIREASSRWEQMQKPTTRQHVTVWAHRDWSSKHRAYTGLHQVLCVCIIAVSLAFLWDSWPWEWVGLWLSCLLLGPLPLPSVTMTSFGMTVFASSYFILFCHVCFLSLRSLIFSSEGQKGSGSWGDLVPQPQSLSQSSPRKSGLGSLNLSRFAVLTIPQGQKQVDPWVQSQSGLLQGCVLS